MHPSQWPNPLVAAMFLVGVVSTVLLAPILRQRFTKQAVSPETHLAAYEVFKLVGQLTGIFLVFLLLQSMNYFREAEVAVSREAGDLLQLEHALADVDAPQANPARARLRDYVRALVEEEWPSVKRAEESAAATAALARLQEAVSALMAKNKDRVSELSVQKSLHDVEDDRTVRSGAAESGLPRALWRVTSGLFILMLIAAAFLNPGESQTKTLGVYAAALALLAGLLFMIDGPYRGDFSVSPRPLEKALAAMGRAP